MTPDDLVEMELIKQLKYRYVRLIDLKEWDQMASLFTEDATASFGGGAYRFEGRDEILAFYRRNLSSTAMLTSHKVHHPEIALNRPDRATGTWALEDLVLHTEFGVNVRGAAFYEDEYAKDGGTWRIRHTGYLRVFEELEPRRPDARVTASWWATGGRSELPVS